MPHHPLAVIILLVAMAVAPAADAVLVDGLDIFQPAWVMGGTKEVVAAPAPQGTILRLTVLTPQEGFWKSQTFAPTRPEAVAVGDTVTATMRVRCAAPAAGRITIVCGRDGEPYTNIIDQAVDAGPEWKEVVATAVSPTAIAPGTLRFGFCFGHLVQTIEVADLRVVRSAAAPAKP
jgi:hypothetical protein